MNETNTETVDERINPTLKAFQRRRAEVAESVLKVLRGARDNSPEEWDALMKSESGPSICGLWDHLRELIKQAE